MGRLPSSFRKKNRTTHQFREQYARLPEQIRQATRASCILFDKDPRHPSLRLHDLEDNKRGQHVPDSTSVSVTMQYRAIYVTKDDQNRWYWIGTHADFDKFTGRK